MLPDKVGMGEKFVNGIDELLKCYRFTCPERQADAAGCQYRGKFYKVGEAITGQFLPKRCYEECICEQGQDEG